MGFFPRWEWKGKEEGNVGVTDVGSGRGELKMQNGQNLRPHATTQPDKITAFESRGASQGNALRRVPRTHDPTEWTKDKLLQYWRIRSGL